MSVRDTIERWRAEFRLGVDDAHGLWRSGRDTYYAPPPPPPVHDWSPAWNEPVRGNGSGLWGVAPPQPPAPHDPLFEHLVQLCEEQEAQLATTAAQSNALVAELERTRATRDRYQTNGLKLLDEVKALRAHRDAIRKIGWHEISKATHPDTAPPEQRAAREELFKLVKTMFGR